MLNGGFQAIDPAHQKGGILQFIQLKSTAALQISSIQPNQQPTTVRGAVIHQSSQVVFLQSRLSADQHGSVFVILGCVRQRLSKPVGVPASTPLRHPGLCPLHKA